MSALDIVIYADHSAEFLSNGAVPPVLMWLEELPSRARIKLLARLELLETRGPDLHGPLIAELGEGIRAVWCRDSGARHLIMHAIESGGRRPAAILLHGVSIADSISDVRATRTARTLARRHLPSAGTVAAAEQLTEALASGAVSAPWAHIIPHEDVELAVARLRRYQAEPDAHAFDDW